MNVWLEPQDGDEFERIEVEVTRVPQIGEKVSYYQPMHWPHDGPVRMLHYVVDVRTYPAKYNEPEAIYVLLSSSP